MSELDRLQETRKWLRYAQEDLFAARAMLEVKDFLPRHVCWLAQQAGEKAIEVVLLSWP
jgi:hypothetical protein